MLMMAVESATRNRQLLKEISQVLGFNFEPDNGKTKLSKRLFDKPAIKQISS